MLVNAEMMFAHVQQQCYLLPVSVIISNHFSTALNSLSTEGWEWFKLKVIELTIVRQPVGLIISNIYTKQFESSTEWDWLKLENIELTIVSFLNLFGMVLI